MTLVVQIAVIVVTLIAFSVDLTQLDTCETCDQDAQSLARVVYFSITGAALLLGVGAVVAGRVTTRSFAVVPLVGAVLTAVGYAVARTILYG